MRQTVIALLIVLSGGFLGAGCRTVRHADADTATTPAGERYTLILFYDQTVGDKALLKAVKRYKGRVLYRYRNFNGMAVSMPSVMPEDKAIRLFRAVKGVLSVQKDRKLQLFDNTLP